ncbi:PKD domain-containing protein [Flaviaesturariibacter flavus]|uniref:PKD domain-containing protein n=1 Tax=Flaviaesturariibacter flavus TaxID=2502780 RepID=A0A4R1BNS1_9BACT|nr:PKD domain-containing protein [Flaviaesturariibacter flavus]TCJ19199.1 PKD domain-containing protein [Flaviaesturariibacter flavus]
MKRCVLLAFKGLLPLVLLLLCQVAALAQCTTVVSTFPYSEDFESNNGGWVPGGTGSDWDWGTPAKRVITGAGSGARCWITAGLLYSGYSNGQNSWLLSPCFDFTGITNPSIRFKVFWETERKYDGGTLEYSTDGGNSWHVVGSAADATTCPGSNWFRTANVTALRTDGWAGNVQPTAPCTGGAGEGSGGWVTASHALDGLGGRANVRLRFRFAAGNQCNNYDGFAIDDIWIGQMPAAANAAFTFSCSTSRTASFQPISATCGNSYTWDFGDPATGASNTSTIINPTHTFSNSGTYNVTLTVRASDGSTASTTQVLRNIEVAPELIRPVTCKGGRDAEMTVRVSPAGTYQYSWSTTPVQTTATATGLSAGSYTVDITAPDACANRTSVTIVDPPPVTHTQTIRDARCNGANGGASITASGGTYPYSFNWTPAVSTDSASNSLAAGAYTVAIRDDRGCTDTARFRIATVNDFTVSIGADTVLCVGETLRLYPGSYSSYTWQNGSTDTSFLVSESGNYSVRVTDAFGCSGSAAMNVTMDCSDVFFPDAFSPNGDGRNDAFGPLGNRGALTGYRLQVYGRWGQLVFSSTNPFEKWDARNVSGGNGSQVFVWVAQYGLVRQPGVVTRKGTVLLVR